MKILFQQFENLFSTIKRDLEFCSNQELCVLVSGGLDSMVLMYSLHEFSMKTPAVFPFKGLNILHFNHQRREEESFEDEHLVKEVCSNLGLIYHVIHLKFARTVSNFHAMARQQRHFHIQTRPEFFFALAHHISDQAENFFIRLCQNNPDFTRFSMKKICKFGQKKLLRPFLSIEKSELLEISRKYSIPWRQDSSNLKSVYFRNQIRQKIIEPLKSISPEALQRLSRVMYRLDKDLDSQAEIDAVDPLDHSIAAGKQGGISELKLLIYTYLPAFRARKGFWDQFRGCLSCRSGQWQLKKDLYISLYRGRFYLFSNHAQVNEQFKKGVDEWYFNNFYIKNLGSPSILSENDLDNCLIISKTIPFNAIKVCNKNNLPPALRLPKRPHISLKKLFAESGVVAHLRQFYPILFFEEKILAIGDLKRTFFSIRHAQYNPAENWILKVEKRGNFPCVRVARLL
ncbi:tRNA lysidine(34) synthetase TilS [Candidatus Riflebacteria bacterium]